MLTLDGVRATIDGAEVLTSVDLRVARGEWVAVIGPNGAGKSSLLRCVTGAIRWEGEVRIDGRDARDMGRRLRARLVSWVAQSPTIPLGMRVVDYVLLGRTPHLPPLGHTSSRDAAMVDRLLADLDIAGFGDRLVETLSGGERQRVLLARALAQECPLLLLDEPTTALDIGHQQEVLELLEDLRRSHGLTVVMTMHDLTLAGQYSDRLIVLSEGRTVEEGKAENVLTEEIIRRYWNAEVALIRDDDGTIVVVPARRVTDSRAGPAAPDPESGLPATDVTRSGDETVAPTRRGTTR